MPLLAKLEEFVAGTEARMAEDSRMEVDSRMEEEEPRVFGHLVVVSS